ncbi:hypothetical protein CROQUDRAFT_355333 [Cronartium quercuum f. sp. fusiforme G11]|uniref:Uncharacterized protein n=1 Tax=Cronartium quercuum f. sp. fusiforme G11 TaxID=708437 RepID=A0A9P6N6K9_9BASI|nr:hypothetical protein CROQUDRAFT_355333 [Cronartium quercuum f. sp. fusiforme G11]
MSYSRSLCNAYMLVVSTSLCSSHQHLINSPTPLYTSYISPHLTLKGRHQPKHTIRPGYFSSVHCSPSVFNQTQYVGQIPWEHMIK